MSSPQEASAGSHLPLHRRSGRGRTFRPRHRLSKPKTDLPEAPPVVVVASSAMGSAAPVARRPVGLRRSEVKAPAVTSDAASDAVRPAEEVRPAEDVRPETAREMEQDEAMEATVRQAGSTFEGRDEPGLEAMEGMEREDAGALSGEAGADEQDEARAEAESESERESEPELASRELRERLPGTVEALSYRPASPRSIEQTVLAVKQVVDALQRALQDMEEVLELIEDAEQQKVADERELQRLQELLRQMTQLRERVPVASVPSVPSVPSVRRPAMGEGEGAAGGYVPRRTGGMGSTSGRSGGQGQGQGYGGGMGSGDDRLEGDRRRRGRGRGRGRGPGGGGSGGDGGGRPPGGMGVARGEYGHGPRSARGSDEGEGRRPGEGTRPARGESEAPSEPAPPPPPPPPPIAPEI